LGRLTITKDASVNCFDAALFLDEGKAIIDCVKINEKSYSKYSNFFYVIDLTDHTIKLVPNDIFVDFT
jgi:hypothetical protein